MRDPFPAPDPTPLTILGLGSPWGDDRVGWDVADRLARLLPPTRASIIKLDRPGVDLLRQIAGRACVLLIDAAVINNAETPSANISDRPNMATTGAAPSGSESERRMAGRLHCLPVSELLAGHGPSLRLASSHGFGLVESLGLGQALGVLPPELRLYLVTINAAQASGFGDALSPPVATAAQRLAALIDHELAPSAADPIDPRRIDGFARPVEAGPAIC